MLRPEKILQMLDTPEDVAQLKSLLEDEIRQETALKTNDKVRVTQMNKMQKGIAISIEDTRKLLKKLNDEKDKQYLSSKLKRLEEIDGCGKYEDGRFVFTDWVMVFLLNDSLGFNPKESYPNIKISRAEDCILVPKEKISDMLLAIKTKRNYEFNENVSFDYKYLDIFLKILGESDMYFSPSGYRLYFKNSENEEGVLLGIYRKSLS